MTMRNHTMIFSILAAASLLSTPSFARDASNPSFSSLVASELTSTDVFHHSVRSIVHPTLGYADSTAFACFQDQGLSAKQYEKFVRNQCESTLNGTMEGGWCRDKQDSPLFFVEIGQDGSYCNSGLSRSVIYILEPVTTKSSSDSNTDTGWKDVSQAFGFDHHL